MDRRRFLQAALVLPVAAVVASKLMKPEPSLPFLVFHAGDVFVSDSVMPELGECSYKVIAEMSGDLVKVEVL